MSKKQNVTENIQIFNRIDTKLHHGETKVEFLKVSADQKTIKDCQRKKEAKQRITTNFLSETQSTRQTTEHCSRDERKKNLLIENSMSGENILQKYRQNALLGT